jgi:hypothetical protein
VAYTINYYTIYYENVTIVNDAFRVTLRIVASHYYDSSSYVVPQESSTTIVVMLIVQASGKTIV